MDLGISGRRALVAASSAGLGLATAVALAEEGCQVAMNGRDSDRLNDAAGSVPGAIPIVGDVSDAAGAAALADAATEALGGIDILVTNAGGPPGGNWVDTDTDLYPAALDLSLMSVVAMTKAAVPDMQAQGWGRVLAITSVSVRQPLDMLILSNTARAGVTGYLKTMANQVAADGVTVNSLQPGYHATDRLRQLFGERMADLESTAATGSVGDPSDFGRIAAFLCSEHARFITGAALPVDGGLCAGLQ
ncbi:SDR family oxidoreductase [Candidatus Poriferisocius sp.]|uniref:SDR family oxidoreductase n=1 Tax=Candidatus Poriferisocius sp. TaxID=3101276 RepID=UPI003B02B1D4